MTDIPYRTALIIGAGSGISASVASGLASAGLKVGLAARNVEKLETLATETGAQTFTVDASDPAAVARLFDDADTRARGTRCRRVQRCHCTGAWPDRRARPGSRA